MPDPFLDQYYDVLFNIETTINGFAQLEPSLYDNSAIKVLDSLIRIYQAQERGKVVTRVKLSETETRLYDQLEAICQMHLTGLRDLAEEGLPEVEALDFGEMVACLKRIRDSARKMQARGGRRAYLDFLQLFFAERK